MCVTANYEKGTVDIAQYKYHIIDRAYNKIYVCQSSHLIQVGPMVLQLLEKSKYWP